MRYRYNPFSLRLGIFSTLAVFQTLGSGSYADTILTFDCNRNNYNLKSDYGSYATATTPDQGLGDPGYTVEGAGTPNIGVEFTPVGPHGENPSVSPGGNGWQIHSGDNWGTVAGGVGQLETASSPVSIIFTPDQSNVGVVLKSFNFIGDTANDVYSFTVEVWDITLDATKQDPLALLWSNTYNWTTKLDQPNAGGPNVYFTDDYTATGNLINAPIGHALEVVFTRHSGPANNMAIDNFRFAQFQIARLDVPTGDTMSITAYDSPIGTLNQPIGAYNGVDCNGTLSIALATAPDGSHPQGLVIKDLRGSNSSALIDTSGSSTAAVITLTNGDETNPGVYAGSIKGNAKIVKAGNDTYSLTIQGELSTSELTIQSGQLTVGQQAAVSGGISMQNGTALSLNGNSNTISSLNAGDNVVFQSNSLTATGNLSFGSNAAVTLNGANTLGGSLIAGSHANILGNNLWVGGNSVIGDHSSFNLGGSANSVGQTLTLGNQVSSTINNLTAGALRMGDNSQLAAQGTMQLNGDSVIGTSSALQTGNLILNGNLAIQDSSSLTAVSISGNKAISLDNAIVVMEGATSGTVVNAQINGTGVFLVKNSSVSLGTSGMLAQGITLDIGNGGAFTLDQDMAITGLTGTGALVMDGGSLRILGAGSTFAGNFAQNGGNTGTLDYGGSGTQIYSGAGASYVNIVQSGTGKTILTGASPLVYGDINVRQGALDAEGSLSAQNVTINEASLSLVGGLSSSSLVLGPGSAVTLGDPSARTRATITTGDLTLGADSSLYCVVTPAAVRQGDAVITASGNVTGPDGGLFSFDLDATGSFSDWSEANYRINLIESNPLNGNNYDIKLNALLRNAGFFVGGIDTSRGLALFITKSDENRFTVYADSSNTKGAAELAWNARQHSTSGSNFDKALTAMMSNTSSEEIRSSLASLAGSSVTTTLGGVRDELYQQVRTIRNRSVQMGLPDGYDYKDLPYFNAWVQGNGGYNRLNDKGDEAGYSIETWGGTAGADVNISRQLTLGLAFTINHSKLKSKAYDDMSSDFDTCYGHAFARLQIKRWVHTLIATGAWNDINMDRSVHISGIDPITSSASTNGKSFGAFYEGTYNFNLDEDGETVLQPLVNAAIYRTTIDSYTETGAGDMNMRVDNLHATHGRIGIGARLMSIIDTNALGRQSYGEVRFQVVQDYGDRAHTASISWAQLGGQPMIVSGSKTGRTGVQVGAGITLPVSLNGNVYVDIDADLRSRGTSLAGNLGFRYNF